MSGGHDKYSTFFYRPHFIIAMVIGSGERQDKREEERPGEEEGRREGEKRSQGLAGGWREEGRE